MTKQFNNAGDYIRYKSPQVKVISVKTRHVLCVSPFGEPGVNDYNDGSNSHIGFGDEGDE